MVNSEQEMTQIGIILCCLIQCSSLRAKIVRCWFEFSNINLCLPVPCVLGFHTYQYQCDLQIIRYDVLYSLFIWLSPSFSCLTAPQRWWIIWFGTFIFSGKSECHIDYLTNYTGKHRQGLCIRISRANFVQLIRMSKWKRHKRPKASNNADSWSLEMIGADVHLSETGAIHVHGVCIYACQSCTVSPAFPDHQ